MGAPGVLIVPLEREFGWDNAQISIGAGAPPLLFGLFGPFAAAFMNRFGVRRVMICALALIAAGLCRLAGDDARLAARPAVGRRGRRRHRADRDRARRDGRDALVHPAPRAGGRPSLGELGDRPARVPAADRAI